jgi:hypothetical protein
VGEYFWYRTRAGVFRIVRDGAKWRPMLEDEVLMGRYDSPQSALDDLAHGHTDWPSCGDPSELGLPEEIDGWEHRRSSR